MGMSANDVIERVKEKIPLKELENLGFTSSTISTWKTRNTIPRADDLYKIAQHINVSMEWLLTGEVKSQEEILHKLQEEASLYKSKYENLAKQIQALASSVS
ncbi:MAG: helix-turn-helix domain-containing protein [Bacteroidales bacterium]|nr:helix-turn-helix domain-containing protein [Candidatus Scybalousia scybalohippi]